MKKRNKIIPILLSAALSLSIASVSMAEETQIKNEAPKEKAETVQEQKDTVIFGMIKKISENQLEIETAVNSESKNDKEANLILEGKTITVNLSKETVIMKQSLKNSAVIEEKDEQKENKKVEEDNKKEKKQKKQKNKKTKETDEQKEQSVVENMKLEDLQKGDIVTFSLIDNNQTKEITVLPVVGITVFLPEAE